MRARRWPAWIWAAFVLAMAGQQLLFWQHARPDADVLALLPDEKPDPMLAAANAEIAATTLQQVVVLVGARDFEHAKAAAEIFRQHLPSDTLQPIPTDTSGEAALDFYRPYRSALLTAAQRDRLRHADIEQLAQATLARLYGPGLAGGLTDWSGDPLALWPQWWQTRLGQGVQPRDGWLTASGEGRQWILLRYRAGVVALHMDGHGRIRDAIGVAAAQARASDPDIGILEAGVPLHAEAAAARGAWEMNTIGLGSLLAVIVLAWFAFRILRPILWIGLSLAVGSLAGLAATSLLFGKVHVLTLVFGTSLVGIAEDYGLLYFCFRQGHAETEPRALMRRIAPGLLLALTTSVLGYLVLDIAPLPGLQQMAVFSASGLIAAFLTVWCWVPVWDGLAPRSSGFARAVGGSLPRWPRWRGRSAIVLSLIVFVLIVGGLRRVHVNDDLHSLQSSPPELLQQERKVGSLLGMPSPAQFYLVEGADAQQVLQRAETLTQRLDAAVATGDLGAYRAVSDWVPSLARQREDAALTQRVEAAVRARVSAVLGGDAPTIVAASKPLAFADWLRSPVSEPLRPLWLGSAEGRAGTVVMVQGLDAQTNLARMQSLAQGLPGVRWIDRTHTISDLLGRYRWMMSLLLVAGYACVALALASRFRGQAWRTLLPTAIAGLSSLALLGWLGEPLQLFSVLAQFLLLGVGVDYGIFLVSHHDDPASWLAVSLGAANTVLSFGLLALSATPALHTFGLTMLFGIGLAWLLAPCFRPGATASASSDEATHAH
jgi:predicted exporter